MDSRHKEERRSTTPRGATTTTRIFYTPSHFSAKITEAPCSLLAHFQPTSSSLRGHIWHDLGQAYTYLCIRPKDGHIQPLRKRSFYQDVIKHVKKKLCFLSLTNQTTNQKLGTRFLSQPVNHQKLGTRFLRPPIQTEAKEAQLLRSGASRRPIGLRAYERNGSTWS